MSEKTRGETLWTIVRSGPLAVTTPTQKDWDDAAAAYDAATRPTLPEDVEAFVADVEERAAKATKGPWFGANGIESKTDDGWPRPCIKVAWNGGQRILVDFNPNFPTCDDIAFIENARADVPALCAAVREQDKRARHAEQERDAFDKRIAELEAQFAGVRHIMKGWRDTANHLRNGYGDALKACERELEKLLG